MYIGPLVGLLIIGWFGSKMLFGFLCLLAIAAVIAGNRKRLPDDVVKPSGEKKKGIHVSDFFEKKALPFVILGGLVFFAYDDDDGKDDEEEARPGSKAHRSCVHRDEGKDTAVSKEDKSAQDNEGKCFPDFRIRDQDIGCL